VERIDRTAFDVVELGASDKAYWLSRTPEERLNAAEKMRQMVYGYDRATSRLQRVFEIVEIPWS